LAVHFFGRVCSGHFGEFPGNLGRNEQLALAAHRWFRTLLVGIRIQRSDIARESLMNRLDLSFAEPRYRLFLFRYAAILAIGAILLGVVSLLVGGDLPRVSQRLWDIGLGTTILAVLATVLGLWLSQELAAVRSEQA